MALPSQITSDAAESTDGEVWQAVTTAIPSRLAKYSIPKKELALILVTMIDRDTKELAVANMWRLPVSQDTSLWAKELDNVTDVWKRPIESMKRKAEEFDNMVDRFFNKVQKRVHPTFGAATSLPKSLLTCTPATSPHKSQ